MSLFSLFFNRPNLAEGIDQANQTPNAVLLDVRTPEEYTAGHIPGSVNLPLDQIDAIPYEKGRPLFVYCLSGARSGQACSYLKSRGYIATNIGGVNSYRGALRSGGRP